MPVQTTNLAPSSGEEAGGARDKTQIVLQLRQHHRLPALLKAAELARSTFCYQSKLLDGGERNKDRYGYRRIVEAIRVAGQRVTRKTVRRLMV
ncbi:IS3 family transposase [Paraburkholderia sp. BR14320]|uniref:IS3 family transposase n=1 Tax=unclassified Paraburkholderia TaxID=2615204 RepID=UPI0034CF4BC4